MVENAGSANGSQTAARIQHSKTIEYLSVWFSTKQLYQIGGESVEAKGQRKKSAPAPRWVN